MWCVVFLCVLCVGMVNVCDLLCVCGVFVFLRVGACVSVRLVCLCVVGVCVLCVCGVCLYVCVVFVWCVSWVCVCGVCVCFVCV